MKSVLVIKMCIRDRGNRDPEILNHMKFYYFKLKYFIRLRENLSNSESEI